VEALHDIHTNGLFNEMTNSCGGSKKYKFVPMNSNQMKKLMGMDDGAMHELVEKIKSTLTKVYVNKRPTWWTMALPFAQWWTNKKQKTILVREIADRAIINEFKGLKDVFQE